jgi:hypothetical protein
MIFNAGGGDTVKNKETLLRTTKVWKNDSPSVAFPETTVNLTADTGAIFYIVEYKLYYSNNGSYKSEIVLPKHTTTLGANYYESTQSKFVWYTRNVTITESSAVFTDDSVAGELGEYIVPIAIYAMHN